MPIGSIDDTPRWFLNQREQERMINSAQSAMNTQNLMEQTWSRGSTSIDPAVWRVAPNPNFWSDASPMYTGNWTGSFGSSLNSDGDEKRKTKAAVAVLGKIKKAAHDFVADDKVGDKALSVADEYRQLGLTRLADVMERKATKVLKEMAISAAGYKRINKSEMEKFRQELRSIGDSRSKRDLMETPLAAYIGQGLDEGTDTKTAELAAPPADVLELLKTAQGTKLFDEYSVLHIKYVPDPILCGKIKESEDLYFIAEWGDDVKLSDIVKE